MKRTRISDAVVLKVNRLGEINKSMTLFTRDFGLVNAVAYGAFKGTGKLTGSTDVLTLIKAYFYVDPVKQSWKLSDAVIMDDFAGIKGRLATYYRASYCSELIIKSHGAGDGEDGLFDLFLCALKGFDSLKEEKPDYALIQFILKFIRLCGEFPDIAQCGKCGKNLVAGAIFDFREFEFLCSSCSPERGGERYFLSPGGLRYIGYTENLDFADSLRVSADGVCRGALLSFSMALTEIMVGGAINAARGISPL